MTPEATALAVPARAEAHETRLIVFSSLFPSEAAPTAGVFIKERMFRVARHLPLLVVAPQPWSPFDGLIRLFRTSFRPNGAAHEVMEGIEIFRPRFFSLPAVMKRYDGCFMAIGCRPLMKRLQRDFRPTLIDAHFLYPDGYAASILAKALNLPLTVTIRGSKDEWLIGTNRERLLKRTMERSAHLIAVSQALKENVAMALGQPSAKVTVIGNGVDLNQFAPVPRSQARARLMLADDAVVILGVGGLIERKGFHLVIPLLKTLRRSIPTVCYLIVGGGFTQGDMLSNLKALCTEHGVSDIVQFHGPQSPAELKYYYSAADVFALATAHEGWANVFLEAMACGAPVVTTRVGGNVEVIPNEQLGILVPFWNAREFESALLEALSRKWNRDGIIAYARQHEWSARIETLVALLKSVLR